MRNTNIRLILSSVVVIIVCTCALVRKLIPFLSAEENHSYSSIIVSGFLFFSVICSFYLLTESVNNIKNNSENL
ncbi:hypothetical protein GCM10007870_24530 [Gluconobacter kondonii]|uniref:Uncharacterized protein n=1 Tax=Gluconobacter kondonii TaxID=941463 RepID=A0ABQ5WUT6_9PROT|nr:hypothetical protein GCM10007870_24530 [Gluconobacter kondonii]